MLTTKDFRALADLLVEQKAHGAMIDAVCAFCKKSNPNFKPDKFHARMLDQKLKLLDGEKGQH